MQRLRVGLFYSSDTHSHIYPHRYADLQTMPYGIARVATCVEQHRTAYDAILVIDNGDLIQGAPNSYYDAKIASTPTYPAVLAMNQLGCEAAIFGNHEFNYGREYLDGALKASRFPWLAANIIDAASGKPCFGQPYLIREVARGLRIAILGLTTKYVPNWESPNHIEGLIFDDPVHAASRWVPYLRNEQRASIVVIAYHGGLERDLDTARPLEPLTGENQGYEILQQVNGIDVMLTGHQHRELVGTLSGAVVLQPGCEGRHVGLIELTFVDSHDGWSCEGIEGRLLSTAHFEPASSVLQFPGIAVGERKTQQWLDESIGTVDGDLHIQDAWLARQADHPFIEFINHVQMWASGASISAAALFEEEAHGFPQEITMRDIISNYKYPNTLRVLRVSGRAIREALERSSTYFCVNHDGTLAVNPAFLFPKPQHFNYDMWEGIEYELNVLRPEGSRVQKLSCQGRPIQETDTYDVVLNNYRASGGGNYDMFRECEVVKDIPMDVSELISNYIRDRKTIHASCNHNWRVIGPT